MPDMLVKLYNLPDAAPYIAELKHKGIEIRRAALGEKPVIASWVNEHFGKVWATACEIALEQRPVSCFIAVEIDRAHVASDNPYDLPTERLLGFACYDVASRGMFGPTGVQENQRGQNIGKALLLATLHTMYAEGYAYAIIGQVGPDAFYAKAVGATLIDDSTPGSARRTLIG